MLDKIIYIKPLQEYTTVSMSNKVYTFVPSNVYKYYPNYGTVQTDFGELYLGNNFAKYFRKLNWFEQIINLVLNLV